jgi:hypothetical protein
VVQELRATPEFQTYNAAMLDCCTGPMVMEQFSGLNTDRRIFDIYPAGASSAHKAGRVQEVIFL